MRVPFLNLKQQYSVLMPEIREMIDRIFDTTAFIGGNTVHDFEQSMAACLGVKSAVSCSSGTAALMLALRACGIESGDEVITTPFTFFATAEAIAAIGAIPVFVDIRKEDYNIDPTKIEKAITGKTKAILPVHIFGAPCDMDTILDIAHRNGLKVIEDCAQAIGSSYKGKKAGSIGDIGCFSFYPTKNLGGCGDGGMCTTNDGELEVVLRALKEHGAGKNGAKALEYLSGVTSDDESMEKATDLYDPYKYYNYLIGYNSRLDAIQAAVLSIKLQHLDEYNKKRSDIAQIYNEGLNDHLVRPIYGTDIVPCWHQYVVCTDRKADLCKYLTDHEIGCGTFYPIPLHRQKAFNTTNCRVSGEGLPVADLISSQTVCLPIYPELSEQEVQTVISVVNDYYASL